MSGYESNDPFSPVEPKVVTTEEKTAENAENTTTGSASKESSTKAETKKDNTEKKATAKRDNSLKVSTPNIAQDGRKVDIDFENVPPLPPLPTRYSSQDEFMPSEMDFTELSEINHALNQSRRRAFLIKNDLVNARRYETEISDLYRRHYNRALVSLSGGTVETRRITAELQVEELYSKMMIARHAVEEIKNLSYAVNKDIDILKVLSDNIRKQMSL